MELFNSLFRETQQLLENSEPKVWPYRPGEEWKDIGNLWAAYKDGINERLGRY